MAVPNVTSIVTTSIGATPTSPWTVSLPASSQAYIALFELQDSTTGISSFTAPTGWTPITVPTAIDPAWTTAFAFYANASSSPGTSWSWAPTTSLNNIAAAIIGLDAPISYIETAWSTNNVDGNLTGQTSPNVDADEAALVIRALCSDFYNANDGSTGLSYPAGTVNQTLSSYAPGALGDDSHVAVATSTISGAGSTGTAAWSSGVGTGNWYMPITGTIVVAGAGAPPSPPLIVRPLTSGRRWR